MSRPRPPSWPPRSMSSSRWLPTTTPSPPSTARTRGSSRASPIGSGATMKLAVNAGIFGLSGALAEALVLAEAAGIDRGRAYDVLAASAIGAPYLQYKRNEFLEPDATPTSFSVELARKDLRL